MPVSPPLSNKEILQHNLHHLVSHNANTAFPHDHYDEAIHAQSRYGSPTPTHDDGYTYQPHVQPRYGYQHPQQETGLGIQYDGYDPNYQSSAYQDHYSTPATSPPTPSMNSFDTLRTRSGLGIPRGQQQLRPMPESRSREKTPSKVKRVKKDKVKAEKKVAKLLKPLSVLTKDWKNVPVVDIEAYVNRSAEVRRKEVEEGKVPGKIKRPMNSFMLYRKAYQNRTKDWCLQNNHQVVSQVCGDSWPLEPDSVKDQFSEWARIERLNHQNAHPGYKFSPTKPGTTKSTKRKHSEEPMSDASDLEDFDWRGGRKSKKPKITPRANLQQQPVAYPTTQSAYSYTQSRESSMEPNQAIYNKSSYQANNPGMPPPPQYQTHLYNGEYYQQSIINHPSQPGVQDVILRRKAGPGAHSYLGLPGAGGGHEYDVVHQYPQYEHQGSEHRIDPSLINQGAQMYGGSNYGEPSHDGLYFGGGGDESWQHQQQYGSLNQERHDPIMPYLDAEQNIEGGLIQDPQGHMLRGHQEGWHVESLESGGGEFDKWMEAE